jgi:hypothetical protein
MRYVVALCVASLVAFPVFSTANQAAYGAQPEQANPPGGEADPQQPPAASQPSPAGSQQQTNPVPRRGMGGFGNLRPFGRQRSRPVPPGPQRTAPLVASPGPLQSVFQIPRGLSMPATDLFRTLGYDPVHSVPLTPQTSFDIAYQCYAQELYDDAVVFARHGLTMCNDARLHLLKGVCELHLGRSAEAERTAADFRNALVQQQFFGMEVARERINDTLRVRFDNIVEYQNTGR